MHAMILESANSRLKWMDLPKPTPQEGQVQIRVLACGICRTDLHILSGELAPPHLPLILGHQVVGIVSEVGKSVSHFKVGDRVGVPWLGKSCGHCVYCASSQENLCDNPLFTGYQINGGFAEFCVAYEAFCLHLPPTYSDIHVAPLLCPGLIGYRALRIATGLKKEKKHLGFYGFGASAHILIQVARHLGYEVSAFTRQGDTKTQAFAKKLGATWAGDTDQKPPQPLDSAIIFAPIGELVPVALKAVRKGGSVICAGIHMSQIPSFPYSLLWEERKLQSVANLTRQDGEAFLRLAAELPLQTHVTTYPLEKANEALDDLQQGRFLGSGVLLIGK